MIQLERSPKIQVQGSGQASYNATSIAGPACDILKQAKRKMIIGGMIIDIPDKYWKKQ